MNQAPLLHPPSCNPFLTNLANPCHQPPQQAEGGGGGGEGGVIEEVVEVPKALDPAVLQRMREELQASMAQELSSAQGGLGLSEEQQEQARKNTCF